MRNIGTVPALLMALMRYINIVLALLMALFAFYQLNDPDAALWFIIYIVPAILAAIAALRLKLLATSGGTKALAVLTALYLGGVVYYWPTTPGFWRREVYREVVAGETSREGMGMMIVAVVMIIVLYTAWAAHRREIVTGQA